jgi:hypothetical protein
MDTLLIVNKEGICLEQTLPLGIFNIGNSKDNDLILPFISDVNISFLRYENFCLPKINGDARSSEGPWGKKVEKQCVLTFEDYTFIYFPNILIQRSKVKDWDASTFPREADKNDYPEKLLIFLLNVIQADQGAILFLRESILKVVVSKKIEFQDQSEVFLQRILESKKEEMVINMSYNTHTLLFKSGLTPLDFCLIQYPVGIDKVVLYLPRTKNMAALPEGILTTLLSLSAGNLATHLLLKNQKELRI